MPKLLLWTYPPTYYCRKGFYLVLLQGVVNTQCKFWDFDFGWPRNCHGWSVFQRSNLGIDIMQNKYLLYKLTGDAMYSMGPWFFSMFKEVKDGVSSKKNYWKHIQFSTRMVVERACLWNLQTDHDRGLDSPSNNTKEELINHLRA